MYVRIHICKIRMYICTVRTFFPDFVLFGDDSGLATTFSDLVFVAEVILETSFRLIRSRDLLHWETGKMHIN